MFKKSKDVRISEEELRLLEVLKNLGPSTSQKVHDSLEQKYEYLLVIRCLHGLVQKGFLERLIINKTQLYRTTRSYSYIKSYLDNSSL